MPVDHEGRLNQMRNARNVQQRKAATANRENEALRAEIRKLRQQNFVLQSYLDNPSSQAGYRRRYEKLEEALRMARDVLDVTLNGLPDAVAATIEPARAPSWARVAPVGAAR